MKVVMIAIRTSIANSASEMTPSSSARFRTISSVRPRVFISVPMTADRRQSKPVRRAAMAAPKSLPTTATASSTSVRSQSSGRSSRPTLVRSPVYAKNSGRSSVTTKSSIRRVTSSVSSAWRGMIRPITNAPKISAMPISSVV